MTQNTHHPDDGDLVDVFAAMALTRLTDRSLRRYVSLGRLTRYGTPGHVLYSRAELLILIGWLAERSS